MEQSTEHTDVTAYTVRNIPEGLWTHFKASVQGNVRYGKIEERMIDLIAADQACHDKHGKGIVEIAIENDLLTEEDIEAAKELDTPE